MANLWFYDFWRNKKVNQYAQICVILEATFLQRSLSCLINFGYKKNAGKILHYFGHVFQLSQRFSGYLPSILIIFFRFIQCSAGRDACGSLDFLKLVILLKILL